MSNAKHDISTDQLARVCLARPDEIETWRASADRALTLSPIEAAAISRSVNWPLNLDAIYKREYRYEDALAVEIARQLSDDTSASAGPSMSNSLSIVGYTGAVPDYLDFASRERPLAKALTDFWVAVASARHTWDDDAPRGSFPVTAFGESEYWSSIRFTGTFDQITEAAKHWMTEETTRYAEASPHIDDDADPARIFLVNVSAAARRLEGRVNKTSLGEELGIKVVNRQFVDF